MMDSSRARSSQTTSINPKTVRRQNPVSLNVLYLPSSVEIGASKCHQYLISRVLYSLILLSLLTSVCGQVSNTTCPRNSTTEWTFNANNESPCVAWSKLQSLCLPRQRYINVPPLADSTWGYNSPTGGGDLCQCNVVAYALMSACAWCQLGNSNTWVNEAAWRADCASYNNTSTSFAQTVLALPPFAFLPSSAFSENGRWSASAARSAIGHGPPTPTAAPSFGTTTLSRSFSPIFTPPSSSSAKPSESARTEDEGSTSSGLPKWAIILLATVGGLIGVVMLILLLLHWRRRAKFERERNSTVDTSRTTSERNRNRSRNKDAERESLPTPLVNEPGISLPHNTIRGTSSVYLPGGGPVYPNKDAPAVPSKNSKDAHIKMSIDDDPDSKMRSYGHGHKDKTKPRKSAFAISKPTPAARGRNAMGKEGEEKRKTDWSVWSTTFAHPREAPLPVADKRGKGSGLEVHTTTGDLDSDSDSDSDSNGSAFDSGSDYDPVSGSSSELGSRARRKANKAAVIEGGRDIKALYQPAVQVSLATISTNDQRADGQEVTRAGQVEQHGSGQVNIDTADRSPDALGRQIAYMRGPTGTWYSLASPNPTTTRPVNHIESPISPRSRSVHPNAHPSIPVAGGVKYGNPRDVAHIIGSGDYRAPSRPSSSPIYHEPSDSNSRLVVTNALPGELSTPASVSAADSPHGTEARIKAGAFKSQGGANAVPISGSYPPIPPMPTDDEWGGQQSRWSPDSSLVHANTRVGGVGAGQDMGMSTGIGSRRKSRKGRKEGRDKKGRGGRREGEQGNEVDGVDNESEKRKRKSERKSSRKSKSSGKSRGKSDGRTDDVKTNGESYGRDARVKINEVNVNGGGTIMSKIRNAVAAISPLSSPRPRPAQTQPRPQPHTPTDRYNHDQTQGPFGASLTTDNISSPTSVYTHRTTLPARPPSSSSTTFPLQFPDIVNQPLPLPPRHEYHHSHFNPHTHAPTTYTHTHAQVGTHAQNANANQDEWDEHQARPKYRTPPLQPRKPTLTSASTSTSRSTSLLPFEYDLPRQKPDQRSNPHLHAGSIDFSLPPPSASPFPIDSNNSLPVDPATPPQIYRIPRDQLYSALTISGIWEPEMHTPPARPLRVRPLELPELPLARGEIEGDGNGIGSGNGQGNRQGNEQGMKAQSDPDFTRSPIPTPTTPTPTTPTPMSMRIRMPSPQPTLPSLYEPRNGAPRWETGGTRGTGGTGETGIGNSHRADESGRITRGRTSGDRDRYCHSVSDKSGQSEKSGVWVTGHIHRRGEFEGDEEGEEGDDVPVVPVLMPVPKPTPRGVER